MQTDQTVSVVVCYFNAMKYIERCVKNLLAQSYRNIEFIFVDDGSADGSGELCEQLTAHDPRVRHIHKPNTGVSDSRNHGLHAATGEWIYFCDVDDGLKTDGIETLLTAAVKGECNIAVSEFYRVVGDRISRKRRGAPGVFTVQEFIRRMAKAPANFYYGSLWNKIFKRSLLLDNGLGFNSGVPLGEDHVLFLQMLRFVDKIAVVDRPVYYYIDNAGSLMHQGLVSPKALCINKYMLFTLTYKLRKEKGILSTPADILSLLLVIVAISTDSSANKRNSTQIDLDNQPIGITLVKGE